MKRVSFDKISTTIANQTERSISEYSPGMYIDCTDDGDWFIGNIIRVCEEFDDVYCKFLHRSNRIFTWPRNDDECWVPINHIVCVVKSLTAMSQRARSYTISSHELDFITKNLSNIL